LLVLKMNLSSRTLWTHQLGRRYIKSFAGGIAQKFADYKQNRVMLDD